MARSPVTSNGSSPAPYHDQDRPGPGRTRHSRPSEHAPGRSHAFPRPSPPANGRTSALPRPAPPGRRPSHDRAPRFPAVARPFVNDHQQCGVPLVLVRTSTCVRTCLMKLYLFSVENHPGSLPSVENGPAGKSPPLPRSSRRQGRSPALAGAERKRSALTAESRGAVFTLLPGRVVRTQQSLQSPIRRAYQRVMETASSATRWFLGEFSGTDRE